MTIVVSGFFPAVELVRVGAKISIVFYHEGRPCLIAAAISAVKPLALSTSDPSAKILGQGRRVMLIFQNEGKFARAEGEVLAISEEGPTFSVEVNQYGWEEVDRRRFPRYTAQIPLALRTVSEQEGEVKFQNLEVKTEDLSLGGSWVKSDNCLPLGSLVEVEAVMRPGEHVRILGLVVRSNPNAGGMAVEFLDYIGASRYHLHSFLNRLV